MTPLGPYQRWIAKGILWALDEFKESAHQRDDSGKFASGASSNGSAKPRVEKAAGGYTIELEPSTFGRGGFNVFHIDGNKRIPLGRYSTITSAKNEAQHSITQLREMKEREESHKRHKEIQEKMKHQASEPNPSEKKVNFLDFLGGKS